MARDESPDQIGKRHGVSGKTIRRWWRQGRFSGDRVSQRVVRFDAQEVQRYVNAMTGK
jgi:predicted site-specific integrase-resolvase